MTKNRIETACRIFLITAVSVMAFLPVMPAQALAGKIYFVTSGSIQKANLDGTMIENVVTSLNNPRNVALDLVNGKIYWTARDAINKGIIQRADLEGSNIHDLVTDEGNAINSIALDIPNQTIYWSNSIDEIHKANFEGSDISTWPSTCVAVGITYHTSETKIYGTDDQTPRIWSSNVSSATPQTLVSGPGNVTQPVSIAIDSVNARMYWTERAFGYVPDPPDPGHAAIVRADLDGSDVEEVFASGLDSPWGIGLDVAGEKVYWTDSSTGKVQRANMDGSGVEDLITGLSNPYGIALDLTNEHKALPCIPLLLLND